MTPMMPHRFCLLGNTPLVAVDVVSDLLIAISYFYLSWALFFISRKPARFAEMLWFIANAGSWLLRRLALSFGLFIIACGWSHLISAVVMWRPIYYVEAFVKLATAALSIRTSLAVVMLMHADRVARTNGTPFNPNELMWPWWPWLGADRKRKGQRP